MKFSVNKKALLSLAAVSTVMLATPALAQNYEAARYGYGLDHPYDVWGRDIEPRQNALEQRVRREAQSGRLAQGETRRLFVAFDQLDRVKANYRRSGYTRAEVNDINTRLERIEAQLRYGNAGPRGNRRDDRRDDRGDYGRGRGWDRDDD